MSVVLRWKQRKMWQRQKKTRQCDQSQRQEWCSHKPRNIGSHQKLKGAKNRFYPNASEARTTLLKLWFWPSNSFWIFGLQNYERNNFYCFSHQVTAGKGNQYNYNNIIYYSLALSDTYSTRISQNCSHALPFWLLCFCCPVFYFYI